MHHHSSAVDSAGCIYEGTKEEEAGWGQCPAWLGGHHATCAGIWHGLVIPVKRQNDWKRTRSRKPSEGNLSISSSKGYMRTCKRRKSKVSRVASRFAQAVWRSFPVHRACTWSSANELSSPAYVLTRKGNPFHFLRPHGVLEVVWGHRQWTTAIAFPKWINKYHCLGIFARVCGPMLTPSFASWCDNTRLREELVEVSIGSFVQVHIRATCSDLVRIDLQAALQRSIHTLHLPGASLQDDLVKMKVFVPQGVSCFSGATRTLWSFTEFTWPLRKYARVLSLLSSISY